MDGCRELGSVELDKMPSMTIGKIKKRRTMQRGLTIANEWQIFMSRVQEIS